MNPALRRHGPWVLVAALLLAVGYARGWLGPSVQLKIALGGIEHSTTLRVEQGMITREEHSGFGSPTGKSRRLSSGELWSLYAELDRHYPKGWTPVPSSASNLDAWNEIDASWAGRTVRIVGTQEPDTAALAERLDEMASGL